jgi:hypothetical protein
MSKQVFVCTLDKTHDIINYILDIFDSVPTRAELDNYLKHNYSLTVVDYPTEYPFRYGVFKYKMIYGDEICEGNICEHTIADYKAIEYY